MITSPKKPVHGHSIPRVVLVGCIAASTHCYGQTPVLPPAGNTVGITVKPLPSLPANPVTAQGPKGVDIKAALPSTTAPSAEKPQPAATLQEVPVSIQMQMLPSPAKKTPLVLPQGASGSPLANPVSVPTRQSVDDSGVSTGDVVVRMNQVSPTTASATNAARPLHQGAGTITVAPTTKLDLPTTESSSLGQSQSLGPVKFSLGDSGVIDHGVPRTAAPATLGRAPELVKQKKYTLTQAVTVAHATDLEAVDPPLPAVPEAEVIAIDSTVEEAKIASDDTKESMPILKTPTPTTIPLAKPTKVRLTEDVQHVTPVTPPTVTEQVPAASPPKPEVPKFSFEGLVAERAYDIESQGSYSIDVPFEIESAHSSNTEICGVFNNGRSITVVGGKEGESLVAIVSLQKEQRIINVKVRPTGKSNGPASDLDKVKQTIAQVFPDAKLTINALESGGIEVHGTTKTEAEARRVLEIIRNVCLVPVEDKVRVAR